jgi:hypothetical protein
MGMFDRIGTYISEKKKESERKHQKEKDYREVLEAARHSERMRSAPKIAEIEEEKYLKSLRSDKPKQGRGGSSGVWGAAQSWGANIRDSMANDPIMGGGGNMFSGFGGGTDLWGSAPAKKPRHRKSKAKKKGKR